MSVYIVADGDSITFGTNSTNGMTYPFQLALTYTDNRMVSVENFGEAGDIVSQMTARASLVDGCYDVRKGTNWMLAWAGTNDLRAGTSAATVYSSFQTYAAARKATGHRVVVFTCLPRSDAGLPADFETQRQSFNAQVRANYLIFADVLVDVALDSRIGLAGCETDLTYYSGDNIHPNNTGYGVIAALARAAIGN